MSAIYGKINLNGQLPNLTCFQEKLNSLSVWGPDALTQFINGSITIAQAVLFVSPRARLEKIVTTKTGTIIAADAILDNRPELAAALNLSAETIEATSDTTLIGMAWDRWGPECLQHIIGDFAFSAFDQKKRTLFLARDHVGSRPLYWANRNDTLIWCTAAKIIVEHSEFSWPISETSVVNFQSNYSDPLPNTFFQHLNRVEPGHYVIVEGSDSYSRRWWNPPIKNSIRLDDPDAYARTCRDVLERAIKDRVQTDMPIGAHLSGGIDSTGVAVIAARQLAKLGRSLCGGYAWSPPYSDTSPDLGHRDERRRICSVGEKEGIPIRFGALDGEGMFNFFTRALETDGTADLADEMPILSNASEDGARLILSGWGGDEGFSSHGFGYLGSLLRRFKLRRAADFIRRRTKSLKHFKPAFSMLLWDGVHPLLPAGLRKFFSQQLDKDYNHAFMPAERAMQNKARVAAQLSPLIFGANPSKNIKAHLLHGHIGMRMETWASWSAPYKLQYRYPLTDRRLLEFLMAIPPDALYPNDHPRGLALASLSDVIPADVTKHDAANEALRQKARFDSWQIAAERTKAGMLDEDCPWFDMPAFRNAALNPIDQSTTFGVMRFGELMTALRLWFMWKRHSN
ncbi:MAG: hypothetical protein H9535_03150 [Ignavibacteria bacterium]|nr:hypothetical protein [Ignavibacteria bacterium]